MHRGFIQLLRLWFVIEVFIIMDLLTMLIQVS